MNVESKMKNKRDFFKIEKIGLLIISLFIFLTMYYYDNQTAFVCIQDNMRRIMDGKWYYIFNGWSSIPYGNLFQGACAIWALPVFILSELGVISTTSIGARLWYKLFILIFLLLDTYQIGKIAEKIEGLSEKKDWLRLYFLSSLLVMLPAVHVAQFDAVYLFFILLGINYYMEDLHYKFLICFMLAIPGKYMPLLIFIPLVLLKEKRYLYIIRDMVIGCGLVVVDKAMNSIGYRIEAYMGIDPSAEIWMNHTMKEDFEALLHSNLKVFESQMSIMVLCFGLLCIWCFLKDSKLRNELAIFVSFLGFAILFAFGCATPYWIILIEPFVLLLLFKEERYYNILFPLEIVFSVGYIYVFILKVPWIYGAENTFSFLLFALNPNYVNSIHGFVHDFVRFKGYDIYDGAISAVMVACLIGIMIIAYPLKTKERQEQLDGQLYVKGWYWARLVVVYSWVLLNIWVVMLNHVW